MHRSRPRRGCCNKTCWISCSAVLVLTRKPGESILIGGGVRVTLVSSSGTHARIAIEAPSEVPIHREEVYERIAQANRDAAMASLPLPGSDRGKLEIDVEMGEE